MRDLLENIGLYAFKKFLEFLMKKYNFEHLFDALGHIGDKLVPPNDLDEYFEFRDKDDSQNKSVSNSTSTLAPTKTIVEPPRETKESQR